jgi:hypothetical protein
MAENKTLKLNNVISRAFGAGEEETQKTMMMFESYAKKNGLRPYGPTVIKNSGKFDNGLLVQTNEFMVQLREAPERIESPYCFAEAVRVGGCILARYRGPAYSLPAAYGKIQVHAFENGIELSGATYTVLVEQTGDGILADVFAETVA